MQTKEVVRELLKINDESQVARAVPCNVQHNLAFIVDSWSLDDLWDIKCDEMGSWTNQGRKHFKTGTMADKYDTYRQSYTHADLPTLKKYLIYLLNAKGDPFRYIQYVFPEGEMQLTLRPHGNAKKDHRPYKRTMSRTITAIREEEAKPREIMHAIIDHRGGIENISSSGEYPRNRIQIYRSRNSDSSESRKVGSFPSKDPLIQLLQISKEQQLGSKADWFVRDVNLSNEQTVFLANEQQILDVERFCTNPERFSVLSVDATFNVAEHYFTFGTYRNLMLETSQGVNPICIGPGVLHKKKLESSYYALPSSIVKYRMETRGVLVIGTDGEENLWNAMASVFTDAVHLRCDIHLKDNVKQKLSVLKVDPIPSREITHDIFGCNLDGAREGGLVDCKSEEEFDMAIEDIKKRWPPLHTNAASFLDYFLAGPANTIKDSMRADIRSMCGLGFPPTTYTQNDSECLNRYVKENAKGPRDVTRSLVDAVKNIESVVKRQFDKQFLAVIGKGTYRLAEEFEHMKIEENQYYQMSSTQKKKLRKRFFECTMSEPKRRSAASVGNGADANDKELSLGA